MSRYGAQLPGGGHAARFDPAPHLSEAALQAGLAEQPSLLDQGTASAHVARISDAYRAMKRDQQGLPSAWLPAGEWAVYPESKNSLYHALLHGRIEDATTLLGRFWRNSLGLIVKEYATFEQMGDPAGEPRARLLHNLARNWIIWRELTGAPTAELATPQVGAPWGYAIDGTVIAPKACRYHLLAKELAGMLAGAGAPIVAEIGSGYGGLGEFLARRLPHLSWIDYDLPETGVIAAYFHMGSQGGDNVVLYGETAPVRRRQDVPAGKSLIMPNFALRDLEPESVDAVVNMFSLSEVGAEPLDAYLERIDTIAADWFVHHNMDRAGVVNRSHERIPSSSFAAKLPGLPVVATGYDPFHGIDGDYRWFIHKRARA